MSAEHSPTGDELSTQLERDFAEFCEGTGYLTPEHAKYSSALSCYVAGYARGASRVRNADLADGEVSTICQEIREIFREHPEDEDDGDEPTVPAVTAADNQARQEFLDLLKANGLEFPPGAPALQLLAAQFAAAFWKGVCRSGVETSAIGERARAELSTLLAELGPAHG